MMGIYIYHILVPVGIYCNSIEYRTNLFLYPFIFTNPVNQLLYFSGVLILFSDVPFLDKNQPYLLVRSGKTMWSMGKILYIIVACMFYHLFLLGVSVLALLGHGTLMTDGWGSVVQTMSQTSAAAEIQLQFAISASITNQYNPLSAVGYNFLLQVLASVFLGLMLFVVAIYFERTSALLLGGGVIAFDLLIINALPFRMNFISPISMGRLGTIDRLQITMLPSMQYAITFYLIGIMVMSGMIVWKSRKMTIAITSEM